MSVVCACSYPSRACASRGLCDRGWCPYIYIYIYIYIGTCMFVDQKKILNLTLAIDLPF